MKYSIFTFLALTLVMLGIGATTGFSSESAAGTGLAFLKLGAGSRAAAMGEAYTAIANDASGAYWNPAGLVTMEGTELSFTHNQWLHDITNEFVAVRFGAGKSAFGVSFISNNVAGIERRVSPSAEPLDVLEAHDIMFGLSYARAFHRNLDWGVTVKYLYEKIYIESSTGAAVDMGIVYRPRITGLRVGLALQNFGYVTELRDESLQLPQTIRAGFAYQLPMQLFNGSILAASDWLMVIDGNSHVNMGMEYAFVNYFALRLGYQTGWDDKGISAGFGVQVKRYRLDYAYVPFTSDLGNSHRITFGVKF
ncbi:MAG: PorV/PorQ family protein [Candidatus Zhuqueibacterota bacterium]